MLRDGLPVQRRELQPHATRLGQRVALDLGDEPGLLGQWHELQRRHDHTAAPPAQQGLDAGQSTIREVDDRLHEQLDLLELERAVERADDLHAPRRGLTQAGVEQLEAPPPCLLGRVHGDVRVADQVGRRLRVAARERDADAAADVDLAAGDAERLRERRQDATCHLRGRGGLAARQVGGELVAAEAREDVALPQRGLQPAAGLAQQRITRVVPVAVVDELEAVDVDEQHSA